MYGVLLQTPHQQQRTPQIRSSTHSILSSPAAPMISTSTFAPRFDLCLHGSHVSQHPMQSSSPPSESQHRDQLLPFALTAAVTPASTYNVCSSHAQLTDAVHQGRNCRATQRQHAQDARFTLRTRIHLTLPPAALHSSASSSQG